MFLWPGRKRNQKAEPGGDDEVPLPMNAPPNLQAQMAEKTNEQLLEMLERPEDWLPEALDAANAELQRRGVEASARQTLPPPIPDGQPLLFPVSSLKLVIMSTVTFGIYEIYWFYKNWKLIKQRKASDIMPFWRAFFGILFCYSCFKEMQAVAKSRRIEFSSSPGLLATVWIILMMAWRLPDPFSLASWFTPLVLLPVQDATNRLNAAVAPGHNPNARFSGLNIVGIVAGGIFFILVIVATFLPK